ncbi:signal peptidase I [Tissierella carlieri]|uniref:Signal peptidase I n=2 Tax=Tissierella carlieri TaxID=689904 RepID=A0ABT1SDD7_9FIRM|nr:signal peptidase I [Tissierella carlieri]
MKNNLSITSYKKANKSFLREVLEWIMTIGITIIVTLFVLGNIFSMTEVNGESMEPTFVDGEKIFIYKLGYSFSQPKAGEIAILSKSESKKGIIINTITEGKDIIDNIYSKITKNIEVKYIIKRVIAIPGDVVDIKDGYVTVNGQKLEESYVRGQTFENSNFSYPLTIPENKVFVLGDNRENSTDSRILGLIDYEQIKGKVVFRLWPVKRVGKIG